MFTIAGLASAAGVNVETVRYYQRRGLMPEPSRPIGGVRRYTGLHAEHLRFIKSAKALGFTLEEVKALLKLRKLKSCSATRQFALDKLKRMDADIAELQRLRNELANLAAACSANGEDSHCPMLERLANNSRQ